MPFDQKTRELRIKGLGSETDFLLTSFSATEGVSRLFLIQIEILSLNVNLTAKDVIGKPLTLEVADKNFDDRSDNAVQYFHAYANRFGIGGVSPHNGPDGEPARIYTIELVPWVWFLTQTARSHIFFPDREEKSIHDVIEDVLNRPIHAENTWSFQGADDLKSRMVKHCVQYRETDFNFLSRILEQYGAYYYFQHSNGKHELIISTTPTTSDCRESSAKFLHTGENCILSWSHSYAFVTGNYVHTDYNFETPLDDLASKSSKIGTLVPDVESYEIYDFPGEFPDKGVGEDEARIRQEEEEASHSTVQGSSTYRSFSSGHKFKLTTHIENESQGETGEYMLTSVQHYASEPFANEQPGVEYSNSFTCIPASVRYRPPRVTPKPIISGIQTAVVTGPDGEEIYTDKYGRIKVFFHWDRETRPIRITEGENCSCWVRVAHSMAGRGYGFVAIPRINQEVIIEFLEGDPDQPLCIGSVYNGDQMPHYDPVEHKTRTYFKSNSSPGGDGFNELYFEDKADEERIYIHAEKDFDRRVKNHSTDHIGGNMHLIVGRDEADSGGEVVIDIEKSIKQSVGPYGIHYTNEGDEKKETSGSQHLTVAGDWNSKANSISQEAAMHTHSKAGMNYAAEAGMEMHLKAGMNLVLEAGLQFTMKAGGNSIVIGPSGVSITSSGLVTINGSLVNINSGPGAPAGSGGGCNPKAPEKPDKAKPNEAVREKTGQKSID